MLPPHESTRSTESRYGYTSHSDNQITHTCVHTVKPRISGHRISGNIAIRTYLDGDGFYSLYSYSHIQKSVLTYPNSNFGHKNTNLQYVQKCLRNPESSVCVLNVWIFVICLSKISLPKTCITYHLKYLWYATNLIHRVTGSILSED